MLLWAIPSVVVLAYVAAGGAGVRVAVIAVIATVGLWMLAGRGSAVRPQG